MLVSGGDEASAGTATAIVVPAKAGTHMWTAPVPQEFFEV